MLAALHDVTVTAGAGESRKKLKPSRCAAVSAATSSCVLLDFFVLSTKSQLFKLCFVFQAWPKTLVLASNTYVCSKQLS